MSKKNENSLAEFISASKTMWRHRNGINIFGKEYKQIKIFNKVIELENKLPAAILDTFDVLFPNYKPLLTHQKRTKYGWHMIFTVPAGFSNKEIIKKRDYFITACRCLVDIEIKGGYIHFDIIEGSLNSYYKYDWNPEQYLKKMDLPVPIGYNSKGLLVVDIAELPHVRVGGTTFTGKSNFLHNIFISLSMIPHVVVVVIDLALLEFSYVQKYNPFASDSQTTLMMLRLLEKEMHKRRFILNNENVVNIQEYHKKRSRNELPYIVLIIDEFAFINPNSTFDKKEKEIRKECQSICSNLAALARKIGIHLIVAMQRPDKDILPGQLKANLPGALSFKTINTINSEIILDNTLAYDLPNIKGRAIWQIGNKNQEVQVMHLPVKRAKKLLKNMYNNKEVVNYGQLQNERLLPR